MTQFEERWNWCEKNGIRVLQNPKDFSAAIDRLKTIEPKSYLEVGFHRGASIYITAGILPKGSKIAGIDLGVHKRNRMLAANVRGKLLEEGYDVNLIFGNSTDPTILRQTVIFFERDGLDAVFIDGDHRYAGVKSDYEKFYPLVRSGGFIIFHDVFWEEIPKVWEQAKAKVTNFWEIAFDIKYEGFGMGIGIAQKE